MTDIPTQRCSRCQGVTEGLGRYCRSCHAAYMRDWRAAGGEGIDARNKNKTRAYSREYAKRGLIQRSACEDYGAAKVEMHHENYAEPLSVIWLCRTCHMRRHGWGSRDLAILIKIWNRTSAAMQEQFLTFIRLVKNRSA